MKFLFALLLFYFSTSSCSQKVSSFNLDFETVNTDVALPDGWFTWGTYKIDKDENSHKGKWAGTISSIGEGNDFGCIAYTFPANYHGATIKLEGFMKIENVEQGHAGLLLRIDGNRTSLAFDNMQERQIQGSHDWQKYSIELPFPEGAEQIFVAGILTGKGRAWFDDFVVTIDGKDIRTLAEPDTPIANAIKDTTYDSGSGIHIPPLTEAITDRLELLGRIWGFLKYHHPTIGTGEYNWDYELFRILPVYLEADNEGQKDEVLLKWIESYGSIEKCNSCKEIDPDAFLKPDTTWIRKSHINQELKEKLIEIYQNRHQGKHYYVRLAPHVGNPEFLNEKSYSSMSYPDEGFRLLALYKYWNIIQYFFPNIHLMDKKWDMVLREYILIFLHARNELEYELAALRIIGEIQDSHANLWGGGDKIKDLRGKYYPPFHVRFIEGKLVATEYYNPELQDSTGIMVGDVITHIRGQEISEIIDSLKNYYPASNIAAQLRDISGDILRSTEPNIQIQYISDGIELEKKLTLYEGDHLNIFQWYKPDSSKCFRFVGVQIGYVTLANITTEDIPIIKETFKNTIGIIIDIRNYPSAFVPFALGSYFVSSPVPFVKFTNGNSDHPGEFNFTPFIQLPASPDPYKGKLIVIVNELSQSQAEYTAMAFRAGDHTTIIGSTTAGADGNVSTIQLPGGLRTMISGIGVYYPDETETQRIGIVPDITVTPTIAGIKAGRDELLEKAIELIRD